MTKNSLTDRSKEQRVYMTVAQLRLFATQNYAALSEACIKDGVNLTGALLIFLATTRSQAMVEAALQAGMLHKLKGGIAVNVYTYLWAHMHDDFMWLVHQGPTWTKDLSEALPWAVLLSKKFHKPEWSSSMAYLLSAWEPSKLDKYPHALKYMVDPSERCVLEAACGKDGGYMDPVQIDAMRPGASTWLAVRKELGVVETQNQALQAFKNWWRQGAVEPLTDLDKDLLDSSRV